MTINYTNKRQATTVINGKKMNAKQVEAMYSSNDLNQGGNFLIDDSTEMQVTDAFVTLRSVCGEFTMLTK